MKIFFLLKIIYSIFIKEHNTNKYLATDSDNKNIIITNAEEARDFDLRDFGDDKLLKEITSDGRVLSMAGRINKKLKMIEKGDGRTGFKIVYAGPETYYIQRREDCVVIAGETIQKKSCKEATPFQLCETPYSCLGMGKQIAEIHAALCGEENDDYRYNRSDRRRGSNSSGYGYGSDRRRSSYGSDRRRGGYGDESESESFNRPRRHSNSSRSDTFRSRDYDEEYYDD